MSRARSSYLILLEGILSNPKSIQVAANVSESPQAINAISETRDAVFCRIDGNSKQSIDKWLSQQKPTFKPTFVRLFKAKKDLSATSIYPTLGLESSLSFARTLSQYRVSSSHTAVSPRQDEYPVWYFFYGALADTVLLTRLLSLLESEPPILTPESISGGLIKWHGKYKPLVDGVSTEIVHGSAYEETEKYEVTRCCITMASQKVQGLTFRFAGSL